MYISIILKKFGVGFIFNDSSLHQIQKVGPYGV
jgi:hypothetical protein